MRKRILSLFLCFVLLISSVPVQVFAAGEYTSDWEFTEGSLVTGDNTVAMVAGAEYTLIEFYPDETGIYTFAGPSGSKLANFNSSFFPNNLTGDAATDTLEWTCSDANQSLLLGVCAEGESVAVNVARTGDYVSNEIQYTVYENVHTPSKENTDYCANVGSWFSVPQVVQQGEFFYGVTAEGEYIPMFVDLAYSNMSLTSMLETSSAKYAKLDENGDVVQAIDYYNALKEYTAFSKYPLTQDLMQMLMHLDAAKGWSANGWLNGWQELCFLASEHAEGDAVIEGDVANTYCTSCGKLVHSEEAVVKEPHAFGTQTLAEGSNTVTLNSGAVYTLNKFKPAQTGVYTFEVPAGSKVANYNTSFNPMDLTGDAATNTLEWTCSSVGQHVLVGVSGSGASAELTITRTGDYVSNEIQYTVYENVHTPSKANTDYCANVGSWFSVPQVVQQGEFFYGVTAEGQYIPMFVDLAYSNLSLTTMLETSSAKYAKLDEDGNVVQAIDYYNALKAYTAFPKYPLTQDLMQMLMHLDAAKGWSANGWLSGWQELCFLASEHAEGEAVIEGDVASYYCTGCNKLLRTEEAPEEACKHPNLIHVEAVAATCMNEGNIEHWYCNDCEIVWQDEALTQITNHKNVILPAADHDLVHVEAVAATCMNEGNIEHWYCKVCETVWQDEALTQITNHKNVILPVADHDLTHVEAVAAACMKEGNIEHWYCKVCEVVWQDEALTQITNHKNVILPAIDHVDENKDGVCDKCGSQLSDSCAHGNVTHTEAVAASCMAEGKKEFWRCNDCQSIWLDQGLTQSAAEKDLVIPVADHDLVHVEAVTATCMNEGNIEHWYCKVCEVVWQDEALTQITNHKNVIVPVAAHDLVHVEAVAASCMAEGNIEHWYCKVCEVVWQDEALTQITNHKNVIVPVADHDLVHVEAVAASCMAEGNIEHWYCNVCEVVWQDEALTQITNHKNVIVPVADHDLVHVEAKEATATENGNIEHWYCNVCEVVWQDEALTQITNHLSVIIPALGEPEIPGNTAEEYILVEFQMDENGISGTATVTVEPGIWYYGAYISGMNLTANGEAVEVTPGQPKMPAIFCFTNEGTEAVTYELVASYPVGSMSNPAALNLGQNAAPIEEGNDQGYFFTWTAEVPGTLTITMPEGNWFYTLHNITAGIYGDMQYSNSNPVISAPQLEVNAGDQIQLTVNNFDPANPWTIPAGTLTFQASFEEAILAPLTLVPMIGEPAEVVKQSDGSYIVYLDKEDVADMVPFSIMAQTLEPISKKDLKWTTSDSRIATVKSDAYSPIGNVTLKKGADGACVITAQNVKTKDVASVTIVIRSYEPRLQSNTLALNSNAYAGAEVALTESYGNAISSVEVYEYDAKAKDYAEEASQRLFPAYEDGILTLTHGEPMKKGTYKLLLKVNCENGETYEYKVSLKVTETLPTVTVKQLNKFNTFYTDSEAQFLITAKDANVMGAELFFGEDPAFEADFDVETGILTVRYSESYLGGETKLKVKGDIMVFCEGYQIPVEKATTISTEKKAPKLALTSPSATLNTALNPDGIAWVGVYDTTTYELLKGEDLRAEASFLEATPDEDGLVMKLTGKKGGSVSIYAQQDNWTEAVKLTFKLNVKTTKPSLKLTASTLKVNRLLPDHQEAAYYYLDQDNVYMEECWITPVSKKASVLAEAEKIDLSFDGPVIVAGLDADNLPKKGTYEFKLTAVVAGDVELTKTFKVTVEEKAPAVKLKTATLKLNSQLGQEAFAETLVTVTGGSYAYRLVDLVPEKEYEQFELHYDAETGILRADLEDSTAKAGKFKVKLYPKLESDQGSEVVLDKAVTVTVQIFSGKPAVTLKTTGKLDTIVPDSAVTYTITKLTNIAGSPEAVRLEGEGAELFNAELTENGAKVTLNRDVQHLKDKTYKLKLIFTISGLEVSANVSLKVTQSAVKFATVKTVNYYQSQSSRVAVNLVMTAPAGASIGDITLGSQTAKQLIAALGEDAITWIPMSDGTYLVSIKVANPGHLVYGKSYSLYLDVTPAGCAENAKPTSVKITVKVAK